MTSIYSGIFIETDLVTYFTVYKIIVPIQNVVCFPEFCRSIRFGMVTLVY